MLDTNDKNNVASDTPEDEIILSAVPDKEGIFFDSLINKVSGKFEKLKIKKSTIDEYIMRLIARGRIYWKGIKLYKPPSSNASPSFFCRNGLFMDFFIVDKGY